MSHDEQANAKVLFRVPGEDGRAEVETLWAYHLGNDHYRLENSPFYAYSVSWRDIVHAPYDRDEGFPTFQAVVSKSGHRTVRILFDEPVRAGDEADRLLQGLVGLGCTYEGLKGLLISVDIPPDVPLESVRSQLVERGARWEHADPSYSELFPEDA